MILLIDIGNTRIKWARLDDGRLEAQSAAPHAAWTAETMIATVLQTGPRADRVLVGNVGGAALGEMTREAVAKTWHIEPEFVLATASAGGVRNAYVDPGRLGVDRWLALIGAHALERGACCVVSVGTAMTIDGLAADGRHLGGLIVPGPDLMVSSLLENTSEIARRTDGGRATGELFADNTLGAVRQGAQNALVALIERAVRTMARDLGGEPKLIVTGGASHRIEPALDLPYRLVPDLVLRGLAVLAAESPRIG
ncbi:MAG TPA: type III pantothenate kinase [Steroidobacteraceae bacterium]